MTRRSADPVNFCSTADRGVQLLREFLFGFTRIHIFSYADQVPVSDLPLIDEVYRHGYDLGPRTLSPPRHHLQSTRGLVEQEQ